MTADADLDLAPRSLATWAIEAEAAAGIARSLAPTAFVPDSLRVRDRDTNRLDLDATVASVAAALLTGQELGLSPMASLRSIDVIPPGSGSPALRANAMRALALSHGHEIWFAEPPTDTRVIMRGRRAGSDPDLPPNEANWTIDRAAKMRLRGFASPDSHWKRQPRTMLTARATAEIVRLTCPEVLLGLPYAVEELDEAGEYAGPEGGQDAGAPASGASPARRARRATRPRRDSRAPVAALPSPSPDSATPGEPAESRAAPADSPRITRAQRARLWAGLRRIGLTDREPALAQIGEWVEREVESSSDLSALEADEVIRAIEAEELRRAARAEAEAAQERAEAEAAHDDAERSQAEEPEQ